MRINVWAPVLIALSLAAAVQAQDRSPAKPVRMVIAFPPGGSTDIVGRIVSQKLSERLGQQVVVENRGGAGGSIGTEAVARAAPDGHTLTLATTSTHVVAPAAYEKLNYDPVKDFTAISLVAVTPYLLVVHPSLEVRTLKEFVTYVKARPGKFNYASAGSGSTTQIAMEMLKSEAGLFVVHIPYNGGAPAQTALLAGQTDLMIVDLGAAMPGIRAGKLRALALGSERRTELLPGVATINEALPGFVATGWLAMAAPPKTPVAITTRLAQAVAEALRQPDVAKRVREMNFDSVGSTPAELAAFIRQENERWGKVIRALGVKVE